MAFLARLAIHGSGGTVAGLFLTNDRKPFAGLPSPELLASERARVYDPAGNLWPGSFHDVSCGGLMAADRDAGRWPDAKVLEANERTEAKLAQGVA